MAELYVEDWCCPVCNCRTNGSGQPFSSPRSVAYHVAGKVLWKRDSAHWGWARQQVGDFNRSSETTPSLGHRLTYPVRQWNLARQSEEQARIQRMVEEREADRDPRDVAYPLCRRIEERLRCFIVDILRQRLGLDNEEWWVQGVPKNIRSECASTREESEERTNIQDYLYLIHLKTIIERNRELFQPHLMAVSRRTDGQREFLDSIVALNKIRNRTAHVRGTITAEDIAFLQGFENTVDAFVGGHE